MKLELELRAAKLPPASIQENKREIELIQNRLEIATKQLTDLQAQKNRDVAFLPRDIYAGLPQAKVI